MTELVSMLVPLQGTLPGWPVAAEPSALQVLGLLVGLPAAFCVIIALLGKGPELIRAGRGEADEAVDQPIWLGAAPADRAALDAAPADHGRRAAAVSSAVELSEVGGASARW